MDIYYFYHSRPEVDPKGLGRRVTICCLVENNKMSYGVSLQNAKDDFVKAKGRMVAQARAETKPALVDEVPAKTSGTGSVKTVFLQTAKEIVREYLVNGRGILARKKEDRHPRRKTNFNWEKYLTQKVRLARLHLRNLERFAGGEIVEALNEEERSHAPKKKVKPSELTN